MDELNINNLPAEILTEIFRYLNERNLNNATIVCQLWNNLIESAFRWSLRLAYGCNDRHLSRKKNFALMTNRKFGTIEVCWSYMNKDDRIVKIFKWHGLNVVLLKLYGFGTVKLTGIAELLNFTPNLKQIVVDIETLHDSRSSDELLVDQLLPDLKKLKILVIRVNDYRILKCFRKAKLATIEIRANMPLVNHSLLVDFLSTQDKLASLALDSYSSAILVEIGKQNVPIPFRLKQLSISGITCQKPSQDYDHLMRFIESQAGYLTEIQMRCAIPSYVYECVFTNMTKLTTLWVRTNQLHQDNDFYDQLKENHNVHTVRLLVDNYMLSCQFFGKFFQKLPNIRSLILSNANRSLTQNILVMAQSLSKLESLCIVSIYGTSFDDGVKFPKLKTLHIQSLQGKINWNEFTKAHPLLTELTVEGMDISWYLTSDDIDQITDNIDLQHIRLGAVFVADNRFFEIVRSKCTNLKVLDLTKSNWIPQNFEHYPKIDVLRLRDRITCPKVFHSRFLS